MIPAMFHTCADRGKPTENLSLICDACLPNGYQNDNVPTPPADDICRCGCQDQPATAEGEEVKDG